MDSPDKKLSNGERNVAKLMVTQQPETLKGFYFTPNATTSNAMRLSKFNKKSHSCKKRF